MCQIKQSASHTTQSAAPVPLPRFPGTAATPTRRHTIITTPSPTTKPRLASLATAAAILAVHERTIRYRIADGSLTGYRVGPRLIRVDLNEVEALFTIIPAVQDI